MKILHIADFHLDSAFSGFEKDVADKKREELRECFASAMALVKERNIRLVLIAGDLFDTPFCTGATRRAVFDAIERAGVPVVIAPGNHDYYNKNGTYSDRGLPENAYVFTSDELGRFDFDELGVSVVGYAFTSEKYEKNPLADEIPLSETNVNILCVHAELGSHISRYAPISPNAIARAGFAYAALGHVHNPPKPAYTGATLIAYSGFPQGRSFDETGEGGVYIIDLDVNTKVINYERVVTSRLTYEIERLDITSLSSDVEVAERIRDLVLLRGYGEDTALRVVLCGSVPSDYTPTLRGIESCAVLPPLALLQIRDNTSASYDLDHLRGDMTVRGEVYRTLLPLLESDDEQERKKASLALRFALAALDKRELGVD